ncbi:MAG: PRC and DUF2382 domain-containing protein [Micromonosporaceae bacterium]|nr:PRC and DUF2382 domain-containing protein [Micromonosporaceae bacterium]
MTTQQLPRLQGLAVFDSAGQRIGDVQRVFYDQVTNEPAWITVRGLGAREAFVPLTGARIDPSGVTVALRKDVIEGAPMIEAGTELSADDAAKLDRYYTGMLSTMSEAPPSAPSEPEQSAELTSFEERVRVDTEPVESGTVRLHKKVVTEPVETSVPVRHEEVRVERVPASSPAPTPGHRFEDETVEVTLHEERPTVAKEAVPVETVRVTAKSETDERPVSDQVRRERIEVQDQRPGQR